MTTSADERDIGGMDVPFVEEQLNEFNCAMAADDEVEEMVHKMNAISTTYAMDSVDFMDGLIAFMKNCKKTEVSMRILDDYEQQILLKLNNAKNAPKRAAPDLRKEREVLRELSFATDFAENVAMVDETVEDGAVEQHAEFEAAFDDDKNYTPQPKIRKTTTPNGAIVAVRVVGDGFGWPVKSSYTGAAFVGANANGGASTDSGRGRMLPTLRVISECNAGAYTHGYGNIFNDICAIVPCGVRPVVFEHAEDDAENQQHLSASTRSLIGTILPTDGNSLSFENALLFTESRTFQLDFEHVDNISIYPGMKISAKCLIDDTPGGLCRVQSVIEPSKLQMADLEEDDRQQQHMAMGQLSRLKVVIACGPFMSGGGTAANSDQFVELLNSVATANANVLILCGPFVPQAMALSTEAPEAIFANLLIEITKRLGMHSVRVLILPNAQSDLNSMPYFPTPPLIRPSKISLPNSVTFLPDPAVFEVHSVRFAVSSSEILMHLCRKEIYKSANVENEDRMRRLIAHLFRARSIYPLYPADPEFPLSLPNAHTKLHLAKRPHVMILPSLLQPVTKVVDDCVVINPGRFDRGKGVGTFSVLDLDLLASARASNGAAAADGGGTSIAQFCEVSLFSTQRC
uniref:DNA polymerase alpha subunit B n=1 Tax=Globodera rostochiensis TaxID=31243 RepID=A0A914HER6_GLORO